MKNLINKMSQIFSDSMNDTNGRRILHAWNDMQNDIKIEIRRSMKVLLNELIKDNDIIVNNTKNESLSFKYLYIISAYEGGKGYVAQNIYKINSNTEEMRNACKEDFKRNNPEASYYMHLCSEFVVEIEDVGIDAFIKDGNKCLNEYQKEQKEIEKQELVELERLQKKYNRRTPTPSYDNNKFIGGAWSGD